MLLTSSDTKRKLMHLFLFTNLQNYKMYSEYKQLCLGVVCLFVQLIKTQEPRNQFASTLIWKPCNAQPTCTFNYPSWAIFSLCTANYAVTKVAPLYNHGNIHSVLVKNKLQTQQVNFLQKQICFRPTLGSQASLNLICLGDARGSRNPCCVLLRYRGGVQCYGYGTTRSQLRGFI